MLAAPRRRPAAVRHLDVFDDLPLLCGCADPHDPGCDAGCD